MSETRLTQAREGARAYFNQGRCSGHAQFNGRYCRDAAGPDQWCIHCAGYVLLAEVDRLTARWEALKADATALHGPALRISEQEGGDSATALGVLWLGKAIAYETMLGAMSRLEQTP